MAKKETSIYKHLSTNERKHFYFCAKLFSLPNSEIFKPRPRIYMDAPDKKPIDFDSMSCDGLTAYCKRNEW